jgi:hypothetical protein
MPLLNLGSTLEDPAVLFFGFTVLMGLIGFALLMLYPLGRE